MDDKGHVVLSNSAFLRHDDGHTCGQRQDNNQYIYGIYDNIQNMIRYFSS